MVSHTYKFNSGFHSQTTPSSEWKYSGPGKFLAPSAAKRTRRYDIECPNHHPSLSTQRPKGLNHSKMKWWAIYRNLPMDVIVKIPHRPSGDSHGQQMFLTSSADKKTWKYDKECSKHHPSLSTQTPKGLSRSKRKWSAIYTNLPMDVINRIAHPWSGDSQFQETWHRVLQPPALTINTKAKGIEP